MKGPKVYLVDDDVSILRGLSRLLQAEGFEVASFKSPGEFLAAIKSANEGCVVADLRMPEMNGLEMHESMQRSGSTLPVVFLTGFGEISQSVRAMKRGAINFLQKPVSRVELLAAIKEGFDAQQTRRALESEVAHLRERFASLTPREREVCLLATEGLLNKQTAGILGTSEKTVKAHRAQVMQKMKAVSLADLVRMVDRLGVRKHAAASP